MAFINVSEEDLQQLDSEKDSKNTKRVIHRSVHLFRSFLGERRDFENFNKEELNKALRKFFASIRKSDGSELRKSSLASIKYGKFLKDTCQIDINNDSSFVSCVTTFKSKVANLKRQGKGSVDHKDRITEEDLLKLHSADNVAFNINTPCGLQKKVWFDIMFFFCRRGRENIREMRKDTFAVAADSTGRRFVHQVVDEADKNHSGQSMTDDTIGEGKMYEQQGDPKCPVATFQKYISKLHPGIVWLWQRPLETFNADDPVWYCKSPVGLTTLSGWMSQISKVACLSRRYTNHCIRATSISALDRAGLEARHVMRISGHRSESSIRSYSKRLCESKQLDISDTLARSMKPASIPTVIPNQPVQTVTSGSVAIDDLDILNEVFSDDNLFLEVETLNRQNLQPTTNQPVLCQQNTVELPVSQQNSVIPPVSAPPDNFVVNNAYQSVDHMGMANNLINYMPAPQINNTQLEHPRPAIMYNINPNLNNCAQVHFHFHGK